MNLLCGFYYERGLAFIVKVSDEEYESLPEKIEPKVEINKEEDNQVVINFGFTKLPYTLFEAEKLPEQFDVLFLVAREWEFYCTKTVPCQLTREVILEARGMSKAIENFYQSR